MSSFLSHPALRVAAACLSLSLAACASMQSAIDTANTALGVAAERPSISDEDEERLAQANALAYEGTVKLSDDVLTEQYLTEVVQRIVAVARKSDFAYRVRLVDDPSPNAHTVGGGLIYVHTGLLARMQSEAQLATVLAHEVAHVTERHIPRALENEYRVKVAGSFARTAGGGMATDSVLRKAGEYVKQAAVNGHGRDREEEADKVGLGYLAAAGYDPREAEKALEQLLREYGDPAPLRNFFYGNHPRTRERMEYLRGLAAQGYMAAAAERTVNTEEFQRRTRAAVILAGQRDYEEKRYRTARAMFEKVLPVAGDDPVPHHMLGRIVLETGGATEMDAAMKHLAAALKIDPDHAPSHRELGMVHYRRKNPAAAVASLQKYLALAPEASDAARVRGIIAELKRR